MKLKIGLKVIHNTLVYWVEEQEGLPRSKYNGIVKIDYGPLITGKKILLRGCNKCCDKNVDVLYCKTAQMAIDIKTKFLNAISEELFETKSSDEPNFTMGEKILVRSFDDLEWEKRKYLCTIPCDKIERRIICYDGFDKSGICNWKYAKKIQSYKYTNKGDIYTWESN